MTRDETRRTSPSRLYRNPRKGVLRGVCAGVADYFGVEPWVVRGLTLLCLFFFFVPTVLIYVIAGVLLPEAPERLYDTPEEAHFWRDVRTAPAQTFAALRHRFRELEHRLRALEAAVTSREFRLKREINDL